MSRIGSRGERGERYVGCEFRSGGGVSGDWPIPDDIHAEASRRLDRWLETEHRAPDELFIDQSAVVVLIGTFSGRDRAIDGTVA